MDKEVRPIIDNIKKGQFAPIYWLQGEEPYNIDYISDFIEDNVLKEEEKGFNQIILYGKDVDVNTVLQNARRFPMMSDKQVLIVKEAQEIKDINREDGQKQLVQYCENPTTSTILVFNYKYKKLDNRKALPKSLAKAGIVFTSKKIWDKDLIPWIEAYVKMKKLAINDKGKILLAESIGTNLSRMANEIDKLKVNLSEGETIDENHIQKYIGISKDYNIFELQKALAYRNGQKAFQITNYFGENTKSHPLVLTLSGLYSYFSKLLLAYELKVRSDKDIQQKLGMNYFAAKDFRMAISNYNYSKAVLIMEALKTADLQSKGIDSPPMSEKEILKELMYRILH